MVYIFYGKIASGKSTAAKRLAEKTGSVVLCTDELMRELFSECEGREIHLARSTAIEKYFLMLCERLDRAGVNVILDHGFWTQGERKLASDFCKSHGIKHQFVLFNKPYAVRLERLKARNGNAAAEGDVIPLEMLPVFDGYFEL